MTKAEQMMERELVHLGMIAMIFAILYGSGAAMIAYAIDVVSYRRCGCGLSQLPLSLLSVFLPVGLLGAFLACHLLYSLGVDRVGQQHKIRNK